MKPWTHLRSSDTYPFLCELSTALLGDTVLFGAQQSQAIFYDQEPNFWWRLGSRGEQLNRLEPLVPARSKTWGCRGGHLARRAATA